MNNFENSCQEAFARHRQYWHCYTSGKETPVLFTCNEDLTLVMNIIAQAGLLYGNCVVILAFEVMNNHFHFILAGTDHDAISFFDYIRKRLGRFFTLVRNLKFSMKQILDLKSMRNNIVYVNRNGYVANPFFTPFSYPWGTGPYYFNVWHYDGFAKEKTIPELRRMFRGRAPVIPEGWEYVNGYITPDSYCSISLGMAMFRDAHQYFAMVSKNVEAYAEIATELDDSEFMTDTEMFPYVTKMVRDGYGVSLIRDLSPAQKLDLARQMKLKLRSSNGQIRRILGLSQFDVDNLFPLSRKD